MILIDDVFPKYENELTFWLNPASIKEYVGVNYHKYPNSNTIQNARRIYYHRIPYLHKIFDPFKTNSFCIPNKHYKKPESVVSNENYIKVHDLFIHKIDYTKSIWFKEFYDELNNKGKIRHKLIVIRSEAELHDFFNNYALRLINSMLSEGYLKNDSEGIGNIMIGSNGEIVKSNNGDHRFFTAKIIGLKSMPFKVNRIHENFLYLNKLPNRKESIPDIIEKIQSLSQAYK